MKTILIVGSDYYRLNQNLADAFNTLGFRAKILVTNLGINKDDIFVRVKNKIGFSIEKYKSEKIITESNKVKDAVNDLKPDFLLVRSGVQITTDTIKELSKTTTTVLLLGDSLSRYPQIVSFVYAYDYVFTFEPNDVPILKTHTTKPVNVFSGSYSENIFYKIPNIEKSIDVSFVGSMYPFRREILERLAEECKDLTMVFYGAYTKKYQLIKRARIKKAHSFFTDCDLPYNEANVLYNKSKICLNLHHPQSKMGWNNRLPEILGTGSFEIATETPAIKQQFYDSIVTYSSCDELIENIRYYLSHENEREAIAKRGYKKAIEEYTTTKVLKKMIETFDS